MSPKCTNCVSRVLYVILIRSWFTKSFEYMLPWYYRYLIIVPKLSSTKYVPYPIFTIIETIIMLCLNCGITYCERYLTPVPKLWCTIIVMVRFCTDLNVFNPVNVPILYLHRVTPCRVNIWWFHRCTHFTMSLFCVRPKKSRPHETRQDKTRRDKTNKGRDAALAPAEGSKSRFCIYC